MFHKLMVLLTVIILVSLAIMPVTSVQAQMMITELNTAEENNALGGPSITSIAPVSGGLLRFPVSGPPNTLDPAEYSSESDLVLALQIFEGLTQLDQNNNVIPAIASSWSSPDAMVWTFNLRNDVYFHNGRQVTAGDFIYSWNRAKNIGALYSSMFDDVASFTAPDDFTFIVTLSDPSATFPVRVTMPVFAVIPSEAANTIGTNPVGTGPFKFAGWTADKITLQKYSGYYGTPAYLNGIEFKFYPDINDAWADFWASNLDVAPIPTNQWSTFKSDPNAVTGKTMLLQAYGIDITAFPDVRVRKAFQRAINRTAIASDPAVWGYDPLSVANGVVSPGKGAYDNSDITIPHDPTEALNLLASAGWTDTNADGILDNGAGANLNVVVQDFTSVAGHARSLAIANNLGNIGGAGLGAAVTMTTNREAATIEQLGWISDYPAPDNDLLTFQTGASFAAFINYSSATFDNHVGTALATLNETTRNTEFHAADAQVVLTDAAVIPLYYGSMIPVLKKPYVYDLLFPAQGYSNIQLKYTWMAFSISGNAGVAGATLSYTDGTPKTVTADGSGNYTITVPVGWTGTVTPSLAADAFCPASVAYANVQSNRTMQHYAHAACPNFGLISKWTSSFDLSHGWTVSDFVRTVGDVSGDGMADVVGFGLDGVYVAVSTGSNFPAPTKWTSAFDLSHGWTVSQFVRTVGDVSGDGKADLVGFGLDGVYVGVSTGTSFNTPTKWTTSFDLSHGWTVSDFVRTVGDVNGDNKADLVGFGLDGVYVSLSTGSSFPAPTKWTSSFDLVHGWTVAQFVRTVGDVNGDGKADLVGFGLDGVYVATSTGSGFNAVSKWTGSFALANGWTVAQYVRLLGDVNGDGKMDVVGFGQDGVYIGLSTGTTFSLPSRRTTSFDLSHGWTVAQYVRTVGDVNGGGKADLVGFGLDGVYIALAQ